MTIGVPFNTTGNLGDIPVIINYEYNRIHEYNRISPNYSVRRTRI